ncbi:MAG: hypothetical protein AVDCRST_MAG93-5805, partial [uncultured Chloroflexia bacterium]
WLRPTRATSVSQQKWWMTTTRSAECCSCAPKGKPRATSQSCAKLSMKRRGCSAPSPESATTCRSRSSSSWRRAHPPTPAATAHASSRCSRRGMPRLGWWPRRATGGRSRSSTTSSWRVLRGTGRSCASCSPTLAGNHPRGS